MPAHGSSRKRSGGVAAFEAPMGRAVKLITGASWFVLATVIVVPQMALRSEPAPLWARFLAPAVVLIAFGIISLFLVRGYTLKGRELLVRRLFWETRFPLHDLKSAHADRSAMNRAWRTMGNGGLFVFAGWFRNKRLGRFRALVTDTDRCVVLVFKDWKLVISPGDPEGFIAALGPKGKEAA